MEKKEISLISRRDGTLSVTIRWLDGYKKPSLCIEENGSIMKVASFSRPNSAECLEEFVRRMVER